MSLGCSSLPTTLTNLDVLDIFYCRKTLHIERHVGVSDKVQKEYLHLDLDFWTKPFANDDHTENLDALDIFYGHKNSVSTLSETCMHVLYGIVSGRACVGVSLH